MNAKEGSARPAALGRGLDTLMGNEEERDAPSAAETPDGPEGPHRPATPDARRCQDPEHAHGKSAGLVGGLIAGGAAGAVAVAAFTLLGVRAVLAMAPSVNANRERRIFAPKTRFVRWGVFLERRYA